MQFMGLNDEQGLGILLFNFHLIGICTVDFDAVPFMVQFIRDCELS